ncbi:hypothetical protein FB451DRAFT_1396966 [Mycena latifolia]|nr:hypothetical protein FB451DRAFT_1396966 [Mycena latifolia]
MIFGLVRTLEEEEEEEEDSITVKVPIRNKQFCRYLAENCSDHGTPLVSMDLRSQALFEQAASVKHSTFQLHALAIYVEGLREPPPEKPGCVGRCGSYLPRWTSTANRRFLAGDEFTLIDLFHVSFGCLLVPAGCALLTTKGPNVAQCVHPALRFCWD